MAIGKINLRSGTSSACTFVVMKLIYVCLCFLCETGSNQWAINMFRQEKFLADISHRLHELSASADTQKMADDPSIASLRKLQQFFLENLDDCIIHVAGDAELVFNKTGSSMLEQAWTNSFFPHALPEGKHEKKVGVRPAYVFDILYNNQFLVDFSPKVSFQLDFFAQFISLCSTMFAISMFYFPFFPLLISVTRILFLQLFIPCFLRFQRSGCVRLHAPGNLSVSSGRGN